MLDFKAFSNDVVVEDGIFYEFFEVSVEFRGYDNSFFFEERFDFFAVETVDMIDFVI